MKQVVAALAFVLSAAGIAGAASAINEDGEAHTLIVNEDGASSELSVQGGETVEFCPSGCFVTLPNGDRLALTGSETLVIKGGTGALQ